MNKLIKVFHDVGPCEVDVDAVVKSWDHRFVISQWTNPDRSVEFRLIKYLRRGSACTDVKCTIRTDQAKELISRLNLVSTDGEFNSGKSWRKQGWTYKDSQAQMQSGSPEKFNFIWLNFPGIEVHGLRSVPQEAIDGVCTYMDSKTRSMLKKRPLDFMAYWDSVDTGADVLGLVANMAPGYRAVMWEQAREAQSRLFNVQGNVFQLAFGA